MQFIFLLCAVVGGTIFVLQFALSLLGIGGDDIDLPGDVDLDIDLPDGDEVAGHGSTHLFGILSLRTVAAALAFFGLGGLWMMEMGAAPLPTLLVALGTGLGAMYLVHYVMRSLYRLRHDGTARIEWTVGESATVYVPIPGAQQGRGKVQIRTRSGIRECAAVTSEPNELQTGAVVRIVQVVGPSLVEVVCDTSPVASQSSQPS